MATSHGPNSYGVYTYGLHSHGLYRYDLYSNIVMVYNVLASIGMACRARHSARSYILMACIVVAGLIELGAELSHQYRYRLGSW